MTNIYKTNTSAERCQQYQVSPELLKPPEKTIPYRFIEVLKEKLRGTASKTSMYKEVIEIKNGVIRIKKIPITSIRGNAVYAWNRNKAIKCMMKKLKRRAIIVKGTFSNEYTITNTLFLTCTLRYNVEDYKAIERTWELFRDNSSDFTTALKRIPKKDQKGLVSEVQGVEYIQTFEAHSSSACHSHIVLVLEQPVVCQKQVVIENGKVKTIYVPSENVKNILFSKYEKIFGKSLVSYDCFNVRGAYSIDDLGGYISKEITKQHGNIEPILKKVDKDLNQKEPLTDREVKTLYLHYFTHVYKMAMLRTSRNLSCVDNEKIETENDPALDSKEEYFDKNETEYKELGRVILTNKQLYQHMKRSEISPYSGFLREGKEKQVVSEIIARVREQKERINMLANDALRL
jgi:hypothetical protein